jgi:hypothetical protein
MPHTFLDVGGNLTQNLVSATNYHNVTHVNPIPIEDIAHIRAVSIDVFHTNSPIFMHIAECGFQESSQSRKCRVQLRPYWLAPSLHPAHTRADISRFGELGYR